MSKRRMEFHYYLDKAPQPDAEKKVIGHPTIGTFTVNGDEFRLWGQVAECKVEHSQVRDGVGGLVKEFWMVTLVIEGEVAPVA